MKDGTQISRVQALIESKEKHFFFLVSEPCSPPNKGDDSE